MKMAQNPPSVSRVKLQVRSCDTSVTRKKQIAGKDLPESGKMYSQDSALGTLPLPCEDYQTPEWRPNSRARASHESSNPDKENDRCAANYRDATARRDSNVSFGPTKYGTKKSQNLTPGAHAGPNSIVPNVSRPDLEDIKEMRRKWLESRQTDGTWIKCCHAVCGKWRLAFEYEDPALVPEKWFCNMNSDPDYASCDVPEEEIPPEVREEQIETKYHVGSIVWARLDGYPWWPSIVDDCPDELRWCILLETSNVPAKYHVVFFNPKKLERSWIRTRDLKVYQTSPRETTVKKTKFRGKDYNVYLDEACALANEASLMTITARLDKFGWSARRALRVARIAEGCLTARRRGREIESVYKRGDVVWARIPGCPWWPAMIDECPKVRSLCRSPETPGESITYYVVYFNEKALEFDWLPESAVKLFSSASYQQMVKKTKYGKVDYKDDLKKARMLAEVAQRIPVSERLARFGVRARQTPSQTDDQSRQSSVTRAALARSASEEISSRDSLWSDLPGSTDATSWDAESIFSLESSPWMRSINVTDHHGDAADGEGKNSRVFELPPECSRINWWSIEVDGKSIVISEPDSATTESTVKVAKKSTSLNNRRAEKLLERRMFFKTH